MKTTKLLIGICGALMAMAALAAPAPAQVKDGGGGVITRHTRQIIYDYRMAAPGPIRSRHLKILADGAATLVDDSGLTVRVVKVGLKPADMAALDDLAAKLDQPGDFTTDSAVDSSAPDLSLTVGVAKVRRHVAMGRPAARPLLRRLERIAAEIAAG